MGSDSMLYVRKENGQNSGLDSAVLPILFSPFVYYRTAASIVSTQPSIPKQELLSIRW